MSRLDELIQELCPNGVEYKNLDELIKNKNVTTVTPSFKIKRNDYKSSGRYPIVSQEEEYISGYTNEYDDRIMNGKYICFGDHSEHIKYIDFSFVQGADGLKIMQTDENYIIPKYFYYSISNFYIRRNNYERHFKYLQETLLPIPPLEVQREIVRILDSFTELTAELTARKKQYEFYRDDLLSFNDANVPIIQLQDVLTIKNGKDYKHLSGGKIPVYGSGGIMTYVDDFVYDKPSVLIPRKGSLDKLYYVDTPFWNVDTIFYTKIDNEKVIPKYVFYYLQSQHLEDLNTAGGVPSLTQAVLNKVKISVPSIAIQKRLVKVLDNFDAICSDLNIGLPAEIEARQKQYEYYRDALLTYAATGKIIPRQTDRQTDRQV